VIWNGPATHALGIENSTFLTETQLRADNAINTVQPELQDPENGNFHPTPTSNVFSAATYVVPDFGWTDAPSIPAVPAGNLDNAVTVDFAGQSRSSSSPCGAYASASGNGSTTNQLQLVGLTANITATPTTNQPVTFTATCTGGTPRYYKFWYITGYGTRAYNPNNAVVMQDFSSSTICTFTFPRADNYVVVVWAVTDPTSYDAGSVPIIGLNVRVGN
jgi:hypothetical protein